MAASPKNPSTLIFWNDLENDEKLKTCSLAAKGLWIVHMLAIAARSPEPGVILIGAFPCHLDGDLPKLLARVAGESPDVVAELLAELVASGTASVDDDGRVYNRRMVRGNAISRARSEAGKRGADAANAERQKSGKGVGKRVGKTGSKGVGKQVGKQVGKSEQAKNGLSHGTDERIPDEGDKVERQNSGNDPGKQSGKTSGTPPGKSPPSSLLHASTFKKEGMRSAPTGRSPEETSSPTAEGALPQGARPDKITIPIKRMPT
jgi:hypothetical protein